MIFLEMEGARTHLLEISLKIITFLFGFSVDSRRFDWYFWVSLDVGEGRFGDGRNIEGSDGRGESLRFYFSDNGLWVLGVYGFEGSFNAGDEYSEEVKLIHV